MFRFLLFSDWGLGLQGLRVLGKLGFCRVFGITSARNCVRVSGFLSHPRAQHTQFREREMALVLMCGQPCSGKSTAAACLIKALEQQHGTPVILIDEPSLNLDRNHSYQGKVW
jgi:ABC-type cobalamin/Fe3+-siderophores transport system ATPase subunit